MSGAQLRSLDRKRKILDAELPQVLDDEGTCLMNIDGIGPVAAATIIAIVGDVRRFAIRSLKRHLSNAVYRALQADLAAREVPGEDSQAA